MKYCLLLLSCALTLLTSCDPEVHFSRIVENSSDHTILLVIQSGGNSDTTEIAPHQTIEFLNEHKRGRRSEYSECPFGNYETDFAFEVKGDSTLTINADSVGNKNWQFSTTDKTMNGGGTCECRLIITNSMID